VQILLTYQSQIEKHVLIYKDIVSDFLKRFNKEQPTRIIGTNIPHTLNRIQCVAIESITFLFYNIMKVKHSRNSNLAGIDNCSFTNVSIIKHEWRKAQLQSTRYGKSSKHVKIKKDLPLKAKPTEEDVKRFVSQANNHNSLLIDQLINQCILKRYNKNYKARTIKCI
jgi:hypothetical protein